MRQEVKNYSKKEGVDLQVNLLDSQDKWQTALVKTQNYITDQRSVYLQKREDMFQKGLITY